MDDESRRATEDLLCEFKESGMALLIASHDVNHFHKTMDKRLLLKEGSIFEIGDSTDEAHDNISLFPSSSKRKA